MGRFSGREANSNKFQEEIKILVFHRSTPEPGFSGTGTGSYSGDNGAATSATLYYPYGLALDASGRILYYCPLHRYTVSSAMFDEIFIYFLHSPVQYRQRVHR